MLSHKNWNWFTSPKIKDFFGVYILCNENLLLNFYEEFEYFSKI